MILRLKDFTVFTTDGQRILSKPLSFSFISNPSFIIGANGTGKSALVHSIAGSTYTTKGQISFNDVDLNGVNDVDRSKMGIFLSWQTPPNFRGVKIRDFFVSYLLPTHDPLEVMEKLRHCCDLLSLTECFLDKELHYECSGGESKKIELLQLFLLRPKLALLDEIDSGLDQGSLLKAIAEIELMRDDTQFIIVTHNRDLISAYAHHTPQTLEL